MVDCGNTRCAQERRSFRRNIHVLSKRLPLVLGLERIAADYVDEDTAKLLLNPYPAWEEELVQDFEPPKRCFHCDKKLPNVYKLIQRAIEEARKGKENKGNICLKSLQDLIPFCLNFYTHGLGQELFSDTVKAHFLTSVQQPEVTEECESQACAPVDIIPELIIPHLTVDRSNKKQDVGKHGYTEEDLDFAVSDVRSGKLGTRRAAVIYGVPRSTIRNKLVKSETDEVVVPHDENVKPQDTEFHEPDHVHHLSEFKMSNPGMFGLSDHTLTRATLSVIPTVPFPVSSKLKPDDRDLLLECHLNHIRRLHNLNGLGEKRPRLAHSNHLKLPLLIDVVRKLVRQKFLEVKHKFGWKINSFEVKSKHEADIFSPIESHLPTFSPYHAVNPNNENFSAPVYKHIMESIYSNMIRKEPPILKPFGKVNECSRIGDTLKDIIAKSISEKIRFRDMSSDEGCPLSEPDTHTTGKSNDCCPFSLGSEVPNTSKVSKISSGGVSPPKRPKKSGSQSNSHTVISEAYSGFPPTKKTRPKRGQYRKYNSQLLMDAVKAVQRGEMSVHRAGSYFGVPHSTLEYKVKERHLLRQRKTKDSHSLPSDSKNTVAKATIQATSKDFGLISEDNVLFTSKKHSSSSSTRSSISSCSSTSSPPLTSTGSHKINSSCTTKSLPPSSSSSPLSVPSNAAGVPTNKDLNNVVWFRPYLTSTSPNLDSNVGVNPSGLAINNSASELLIKLQHKVQAKKSAFTRDSAFSLPCTKGPIFDFRLTGSSGASLSDRLALFNESI